MSDVKSQDSFPAKLDRYRELTRAKNRDVQNLRVAYAAAYKRAHEIHNNRLLPVWERFGYGRGRPPDARNSQGKACREVCAAENRTFHTAMKCARLQHIADKKDIMAEYDAAVQSL